jgi:hypothetical protein
MALFATIERDSSEAVKQTTLGKLTADYRDRLRSGPDKQLSIILYGYLTPAAASDSIKEEIERDLMNRSMSAITQILVRMGVPIDKLYIGEFVFSAPKGRKIDLFLQQQGESAPGLPGNVPTSGGRIQTVKPPKPVRDAELSVNKRGEVVLEVTAYKVVSGRRTLVPEFAFKTTTGISPVEISKGVSSELVLFKPKLEAMLRRIGQEGIADKIEFAVKIKGGAAMSKEFARQISIEVAASLQAALTFNITIPGTKRELPIELSYSYGAGYRDGRVTDYGEAMIKVTIFRFKSW